MKKIGKSLSFRSGSFYDLKYDQKLDTQKIIASGYFVKSPPNDKIRTQVSRWQHRWFVLYNVTPGFEIYYYKKVNHQEDGEEPLGKIKLHNASVTSHVGHLRFSFVIILHTDERVWHLCTNEKETYNTWFEKLKMCCPASPIFVEPKYSFLAYDCNEVSEMENILDEISPQLDKTSLSPKENTFQKSPFVSSSSGLDSNDLVDPPSPTDPSSINQSMELSPIFEENTQSYQDSMVDVRYDKSNLHLPLRFSSFTSNIIHDDIFGNNPFQGPKLQKKINSKMSISRSCNNLLDAIDKNNNTF
ncbi:uncharacterized protein LOC101239574 [Hydra vulgaris]|uniref:uncharacterized protein LOC101239574 n=1 Tax=Hydra vulgaris TaxID=6087 RepID=UPI000640E975|nr:uncharacterized protein LOC101239574 [Hydra vulgaris]